MPNPVLTPIRNNEMTLSGQYQSHMMGGNGCLPVALGWKASQSDVGTMLAPQQHE